MNDDTTHNPDEPDGRVGTDPSGPTGRAPAPRPHPAGDGAARTERVPAADGSPVDATVVSPGRPLSQDEGTPQDRAVPGSAHRDVVPLGEDVLHGEDVPFSDAEPRGEAMAHGDGISLRDASAHHEPARAGEAAPNGDRTPRSGLPISEPMPGDATPPEGIGAVNGRANGSGHAADETVVATTARPTPAPRVAAGMDAPTTELRLPAANGSHPGLEPAAQRTPTSVPDPGPAADAPPPWHRVPGQQPPERSASSVDGLLDVEGPTAFLEPSSSPTGESRGEKDGKSASRPWPSVRSARNRPPRQAALQLKRLDPWSVLKLALVLAVVLFLIWLVAVGVLYGVLSGIGVWDRLNGTYADLVSGSSQSGSPLISAGRVFGLAAVVGAINSLLFAVAVTVGAFVYNVSADLVGGIEVTLSERD